MNLQRAKNNNLVYLLVAATFTNMKFHPFLQLKLQLRTDLLIFGVNKLPV